MMCRKSILFSQEPLYSVVSMASRQFARSYVVLAESKMKLVALGTFTGVKQKPITAVYRE